uniref:Uncharacterized protein n=1 Tax=Anguilla anguilla TaxID=7936 RepID=A0A0E9PV30_ANGAN
MSTITVFFLRLSLRVVYILLLLCMGK